MADYISREIAMSMPWANGQYDHEHANEHFIYGLETYKEWLEYVPAADVRPVVKCLECENALRDDSHKIVHCNQNGESGYVWCKKEGCCRAEDFFCANGVSCSCGAGMREVKADG